MSGCIYVYVCVCLLHLSSDMEHSGDMLLNILVRYMLLRQSLLILGSVGAFFKFKGHPRSSFDIITNIYGNYARFVVVISLVTVLTFTSGAQNAPKS